MSWQAEFSRCGKYRYVLRRSLVDPDECRFQPIVKRCVFILLNPSIAGEEKSDPTTDKCVGFAKLLDCTEVVLVNLFAFISTDPKELEKVDDPIGGMNDQFILNEVSDYPDTIIIAAWSVKNIAVKRAEHILKMLSGKKMHCLKISKNGRPWHPLYLPYKEKLKKFT